MTASAGIAVSGSCRCPVKFLAVPLTRASAVNIGTTRTKRFSREATTRINPSGLTPHAPIMGSPLSGAHSLAVACRVRWERCPPATGLTGAAVGFSSCAVSASAVAAGELDFVLDDTFDDLLVFAAFAVNFAPRCRCGAKSSRYVVQHIHTAAKPPITASATRACCTLSSPKVSLMARATAIDTSSTVSAPRSSSFSSHSCSPPRASVARSFTAAVAANAFAVSIHTSQ
mmetsp:Transcript_34056/g.105176  ORF Transcript_34056/g.105176 Transcript_34056/m.105176 type:complete len:229 (-) Transcript_34056:12-698(-)